MYILFVINPHSGNRNKESLKNMIQYFAKKHELEFEFYFTTGKMDAEEIKQRINKKTPDIVVAIGGDGTCNLVGKLLINTKTAMGIIPMGSANGLATELGIPSNPHQALNLILSGQILAIDVLKINHRFYSFHLSDIGFNARIIERFEKDSIRGMLGYAKHFMAEIRQHQRFRISIIGYGYGKKAKRYKASMLVIANASKFGTGALINPTGNISDGKFELILMRPYTWRHLMHLGWSLLTGSLHKLEYVRIFSGKRFTILNPKKQPLQIDGELIEPQKKVSVEVIPHSLQILVPKTTN